MGSERELYSSLGKILKEWKKERKITKKYFRDNYYTLLLCQSILLDLAKRNSKKIPQLQVPISKHAIMQENTAIMEIAAALKTLAECNNPNGCAATKINGEESED